MDVLHRADGDHGPQQLSDRVLGLAHRHDRATTSSPSNTVQCFLSQVAAGTCTQDSVTTYNLYEDPESTPFGVGYRQQHGLQLGGGTDVIRYFVHGE